MQLRRHMWVPPTGSKGWQTRKRETTYFLAQNVMLEFLTRPSPQPVCSIKTFLPVLPLCFLLIAIHIFWGNPGLLFSVYIMKKFTHLLPASYFNPGVYTWSLPNTTISLKDKMSIVFSSGHGPRGPQPRADWVMLGNGGMNFECESVEPGFKHQFKTVWLCSNSTVTAKCQCPRLCDDLIIHTSSGCYETWMRRYICVKYQAHNIEIKMATTFHVKL